MRPVKVTAWLSSPLCGHPPMLDSLLERYMNRHMSAIVASTNGARHARYEHGGYRLVPIPIARQRLGSWLIPLASSPILGAVIDQDVGWVTKMLRADASLTYERRKIPLTNGPFKAYRLPRRIRLVDRVVWFAMAQSDSSAHKSPMSRLRQTLRKIPALGEDVNIGYGNVLRWEVEPHGHDWSWFAPHPSGWQVLMRPLPIGDWIPPGLLGAQPWYGRPCGPYWESGDSGNSGGGKMVRPC